MRLQEMAPDPDLAPRHIAPLLAMEMTTAYLKPGTAVPLPEGNFIAMVDLSGSLPLSSLVSGLGLPDHHVTGRVQVHGRDGTLSASENGKELVPPQPLPPNASGVLHLENGKFGHVLVFQPVRR